MTSPAAGHAPGPLEVLRRLGERVLGTLQHRVELAGIELDEARDRLIVAVVAGLAATLLFGGAVAALSAWLAVALWASLGPAVLGLLALAYAFAGFAVIAWLRRRSRAEPPLFADTLAVLRADAASVRGSDPGAAP